MSIPAVITHRGRDALAICVNAVAILFVLEVDNFVYDFFVSEKLTRSFEIVTRFEFSADDTDGARSRSDEQFEEQMRSAQNHAENSSPRPGQGEAVGRAGAESDTSVHK
ncbi:unnamed protein product [Amoebophrya sp. A25]|nr:unnamed protein product [Amoebophrya sp. A25]|eukprot:GSA25T00005319001.1